MNAAELSAQFIADVEGTIAQIASQEVTPRWRNLKAHEVRDKGHGDPVTEADLAAERELKTALLRFLPESEFVGEEGVAADPGLLAKLGGERPVWVVDPVDGTKNFAEGRERFCVMVALIVNGRARAGWIHLPLEGKSATARRGEGAFLGGKRLYAAAAPGPQGPRASIHLKFMPAAVRRAVQPAMDQLATNTEYYCAGLSYVDLARGVLDVAFFWRTKPWDHLAGNLIVQEAGGRVATLAGRDYDPLDRSAYGLLAAARSPEWGGFADGIFGAVDQSLLKAD